MAAFDPGGADTRTGSHVAPPPGEEASKGLIDSAVLFFPHFGEPNMGGLGYSKATASMN